MDSSNPLPERVLIVDKRLVSTNSEQLHFIELSHPRTKQEQSYAIDHQSKTIFELNQCTRSHSSWFIDDQYVLSDGSLNLVTPIHVNFLFLPLLWSQARTNSISLSKLIDKSFQQLELDDQFLLEKLDSICDIDFKEKSVQLNEEKLILWFRDRIDRLKKYLEDEEHAFDLICEYLTDDLIEYCQKQLNLHGNVRYDTPIGTLYLVKKRDTSKSNETISLPTVNDQTLSKNTIEHTKQILYDYQLNASQSTTFHEFHRIQNKSDCIFAKRAHIWSAPHWIENASIQENCERFLPSFIIFCAHVQDISIDGYAIEIPHNHLTETLEDFGKIFKQVLCFLSDHDPAKRHCMNVPPSRINQNGWIFEFDRVTFFLTTFTPHYSETHPRYTYNNNHYCHILFQPEISFLRHNLSDDTPKTNWSQPKTDRDKIRVAFQNHGREYPIRPTIFYPPAHDMIRPLSNDLADVVEWWL